MNGLTKKDFDEIVSLTIKDVPKTHIIYDRVYEGIIAYHCSRLSISPTYEDFLAIREESRKLVEGSSLNNKVQKD